MVVTVASAVAVLHVSITIGLSTVNDWLNVTEAAYGYLYVAALFEALTDNVADCVAA